MDALPAPGPQRYAVIHGHFYQPPRENPWIEKVEVEPSAQPYHDWNARVTAECYAPNSCARIFDARRRILEIVNNYEHLSYNFGPTLLRWLEVFAPLTYERVLEADRLSRARLGHGNALAQVYNHAILPLSGPQDRETEIIWGLKDFEHRFQRQAEAMWLPETAADYPTLAALVDQGMKFVILSPYQAKRVRSLTGGPWESVQGQTLDTAQAYRCFLPGGSPDQRRFIDVFFYNGVVAMELSFGDLLQDSYRLVERLTAAFDPTKPRPQLMHVATDGENYGHHKKFGELALAHTLTHALPERGFPLINYSTFLELAPPLLEVELNLGPRGEGSSWSCAHGVGRWKEHCGCATGGQPEWDQRWRGPLRKAFDQLNERLAVVFETEGGRFFRDPWEARNRYIDVILHRTPEALAEFFDREGASGLARRDWVPALKLLEMQRHALLMYTSCGWFFADLAGLESLQVLKYAARALQLGQDFSREDLEPPFLQVLERAVSNLTGEGTGRDLYLRRIKPSVVDFPKVVNQWGICWLKNRERQCPANIYHWVVEPQEFEAHSHGTMVLGAGRLKLTSAITLESQTLAFFTLFLGSHLYRTQVQAELHPHNFRALQQELFDMLDQAPEDLTPFMARRLGERYYSIHDMFLEEKEEVFQELLLQLFKQEEPLINHHFEESRPILKAMAASGLPLPRLDQLVAEVILSKQTLELLADLEPDPTAVPVQTALLEVVREAASLKVELDSGAAAPVLQRLLNRFITNLGDRLERDAIVKLLDYLKFLNQMPVNLDLTEAQNTLFFLMRQHFPEVAGRAAVDPEARSLAQLLLELMEHVHINPTWFLKLLG